MAMGAVLLDKPSGASSFAALRPVKRTFETRRVGHTGTLDPFATGLLVALLGRMTRLASFVTAFPKKYVATFYFGEETDTLDPEGQIVKEGRVPTMEAIEKVLALFLGRITQRPPAFSAVHVAGHRAHRLARDGQSVKLPEREVVVHGLEVLQWEAPRLGVEISCGSGTYVRSLARDLAEAVGSCAYVESLRRTAIGPFAVEDAVTPEEAGHTYGFLSPMQFVERCPEMSAVKLRRGQDAIVRTGGTLRQEIFEDSVPENGLLALVDAGEVIAFAKAQGGALSYVAVVT